MINKKIEETKKKLKRLKPTGNYYKGITDMWKEMDKLSLKKLKKVYAESDNLGYACFLIAKLKTYEECKEIFEKVIEERINYVESTRKNMSFEFNDKQKKMINDATILLLNELKLKLK